MMMMMMMMMMCEMKKMIKFYFRLLFV